MISQTAYLLLSGGQDSFACLNWALSFFSHVEAIIVKYGQRHKVEIDYAVKIAEHYNISYKVYDITGFYDAMIDSALLDGNHSDLNSSHQQAKNLPASFVPNRNGILLTIAANHAFRRTLNEIHLVTGTCQTDFSGYPDCRDNYIKSKGIELGLGLDRDVVIHTPLMWLKKKDIFKMAAKNSYLDKMIKMTMTCYNGSDFLNEWGMGCGDCPSCKLRKNGFSEYLKSEQ